MNPSTRNDGFTLIELLVVIVILAVLMAIAIPSYLAQQKKAKDSAAKQYLTTVWKAARSDAVDHSGAYDGTAASLIAAITDAEPEVSVIAGAKADVSSSNDRRLVVESSSLTASTIVLYDESSSGTIWRLTASNTGAPTIDAVAPLTDGDLADAMLAKVAAAAQQFGTANGGYTGMTTGLLRTYDASIDAAVRVKTASVTAYCADFGVNGTTHRVAQTGAVASGPCP